MKIWRPVSIELSNDGAPLSVSVGDLFTTFPYERVTSDKILAFFVRPEFVLLMVLAYIVSIPVLQAVTKHFGITGKSTFFRRAVALHNLSLAIFSLVVAINLWPIYFLNFFGNGWESTYCDQDGSFWGSGAGAWNIIFYISKYYEFADTYILILKGKDPSFLQVYHHAGVALAFWAASVSHSAWYTVGVMLNSVIHTIMYAYFFVKTLYPKIEIKSAKYLTKAQIGQFMLGVGISQGVLFLGESCDTASSRLSCAFLNVYGFGLIALFSAFAKKKYKKR